MSRGLLLQLVSVSSSVVAVLSVFHDLEAMERLATRVVVMSDGRVVGEGAPSEVLPELEVAR